MKFGEMLDWALRLRAFGALRAWVGACGPAGGIGADGSHGSRILELDRQFSVLERPLRCGMTATFTISGDFPLDAGLGPPCPSNQDC